MLTSKERSELRAKANGLPAIITIGKAGVTPDIVNMCREALEARELIKVSVLESADTLIKDAARMCAERTRSELVQVIGRKFVLYKKKPS